MIRKTFLLFVTASFLGGCTMIPKYTRPEAPVPAAWPTGPAYTENKEGPAAPDIKWREFFTDERLQALIAMTLKNNRDLRTAALNAEKARALYGIQRASILPTVDGTADAIRVRTPGDFTSSGTATTTNQFDAALGISSWEIDLFGRIRSMTAAALETFLGTEQARRSVQIMLIAEVANAYLTLAADRENLSLSRSTLEAQMASYNLIKRRFEVGLAPELDLRQVQTRVETSRVDVARFTQQVAQDENALNLVVGSPVPSALLPQGLSEVTPIPDVTAGISSDVLLRRPDILEAENTLKAANANIGAARAAFFPRISLSTAIGTSSSDLNGLFQPGSLAWNYAPQLVMPIFDARLWPALKASKVDRDIAVAQYEKAIQSAFRDVADALAAKGTLGDQIAAQESLVEAATQSYRLSNKRYEKGTDIYLNVLDSQRSLYSAQQTLISIRLAKLSNQVRLYSVLGGGGDEDVLAKFK